LKPWSVIEEKRVFDASPWLELWIDTVSHSNDEIVENRYRVVQSDFVMIFALVDADHVIGLWRYKHGPGRINLGLPAGYIEKGETPLAAAQRELLEEVGCQAHYWDALGEFVEDGDLGCCRAHIFFARDIESVTDPHPDDLEEMVIEKISIKDLVRHLGEGKVATLGAVAGIVMGLNAISPG
jgi:8-oxo-dGTP pyrophosphatase MutT (NUDIX family)